ncbi:MAG: DHHA1 domain-containing protein, partial [bacterium]|nr:DHHA1 domain-containing protein [bacterium]
ISAASQANLGLFLIEYEKGKIKGSLRSEPFKGKSVDKVAEALGGGGHPYAAGFSQEGTIEEVLKKVLDLLE